MDTLNLRAAVEQCHEFPLILGVRKDVIVDVAVRLYRSIGVCWKLLLGENVHAVRLVNSAVRQVIHHDSCLLLVDKASRIAQEILRVHLIGGKYRWLNSAENPTNSAPGQ